ncbi:uncharacterized protein LOC128041102 [Gossypium raimondii]|uniref:uncharacterized protein LOC128041102 n=1 Tax=Gossypium raimondii TaxID=29730 RepID=UPI00227A0934|nr:uncharacterized protein LOC128041102 [Gossypium raimondii]
MASSSFSPAAPQVFNGEGYHIWVVKMKTYLQAYDLWEVVNSDVEREPLRGNPTMARIERHLDERTKRTGTSCGKSFKGREDKATAVVELEERFENLKMKEEESCQAILQRDYGVVNDIELLGERFNEARIVEKVIATLHERYEAKSHLSRTQGSSTISTTS